jgi:hypothetical protein
VARPASSCSEINEISKQFGIKRRYRSLKASQKREGIKKGSETTALIPKQILLVAKFR